MTDEAPKIYAALGAVMADLKAFEKQKVQGFEAFNVDDVYANVRPLLVKHGIVVVPQVVEITYHEGIVQSSNGVPAIDARALVDYHFVSTEDGSSVTSRGAAEGRDFQDKATNKTLQQAIKYALIQMFMIGTGEASAEEGPGEQHPVQDRPIPARAAKRVLVAMFGKERAMVMWSEARMALHGTFGDTEDDALSDDGVMRIMGQILVDGVPAEAGEVAAEITDSAARQQLIGWVNKKPVGIKDQLEYHLRTMCRLAQNLGFVTGEPDWLHVELAKVGLEHVNTMKVGELKAFIEKRQADIQTAMGGES